jgi:hypothetical protein
MQEIQSILYLRMLVSMTVSLYITGIILNAMGVEDFGIYNGVGGIAVMFGFFNLCTFSIYPTISDF